MMKLNQGPELAVLVALMTEAQRLAAKLKPHKDHPGEQLIVYQRRAETGFWELHYDVGVPDPEPVWPVTRHTVSLTLQLDPDNASQAQLELTISRLDHSAVNDQFRFTFALRPELAVPAAQEITDLLLTLFTKRKFNISISKSHVFVEMMARARQIDYGHGDKKHKAPAAGQQQSLV